MINIINKVLKHLWLDQSDTMDVVSRERAQTLQSYIEQSERKHTGQIRICVESSLPLSYLWRHVREGIAIETICHQRALMHFSKLRVWDTAQNNGVLIYLLLAERRIEIIADRGIAIEVAPSHWDNIVHAIAHDLQANEPADFQAALMHAVDSVSRLLTEYFPPPDLNMEQVRINELPDFLILY